MDGAWWGEWMARVVDGTEADRGGPKKVHESDAKTCPICGIVFYRPYRYGIALWAKRVTCSKACMGRWHSVEWSARTKKTCAMCHRERPIDCFAALTFKSIAARCSYCRDCELVRSRLNAIRIYRAPRKSSTERRREQRRRHREKFRARRRTAYALERGYLIRQPCQECGTTPADAHHHDYSRPLDVHWLCRFHHDIKHWKPTDSPLLPELIEVKRAHARGAA